MAEVLIKHTKVDLVARFSQHASVPTCYKKWQVCSIPYPELSSPGAGLPFLYNPTLWAMPVLFYSLPYWPLGFLALAFPSPLRPFLTWPYSGSCSLWILQDVSCYVFPLINNKPSPSLYLGAVVSSFNFFFPIYYQCCKKWRLGPGRLTLNMSLVLSRGLMSDTAIH